MNYNNNYYTQINNFKQQKKNLIKKLQSIKVNNLNERSFNLMMNKNKIKIQLIKKYNINNNKYSINKFIVIIN